MTTSEVAARYGVARSTVWLAICRGELQAVDPFAYPLDITEDAAAAWDEVRRAR